MTKGQHTTLYYFTGTGNSLACGRAIAAGLGDVELRPIALFGDQKEVRVPPGRMGIVCPVYFCTLPLLVQEFIQRLDLTDVGYIFVVVTTGGLPGVVVEHAAESFRRLGSRLDAAFTVEMLGNYVALYNVGGEKAVQTMQERMEREVARIVGVVGEERRSIERVPWGTRIVGRTVFAIGGRAFVRTCRSRDRRFTVDETCISCGTCARVCPVENVQLAGGRPEWLGRCEQCFACVHFCPVAAIQVRRRGTRRRRRYHHPDVTAGDVSTQVGSPR